MIWKCRDHLFEVGGGKRTLIMGILNLTPDSFSDGGRFSSVEPAVEHARRMMEDGADIIDIGGESTRPGAAPVPAEEELRRVMPVIEALSGAETVLSVDTRKAVVAERALAAGARIVNDVSALTADPRMVDTVKSFGAGAILMHMRGEPRNMQDDPHYDDVVRDVRQYLIRRIEILAGSGLDRDTLAVDPGIGFGKTARHNLELIGNIAAFRECGRPVAIGLSRKRFLGFLTGRDVGDRMAAGLGALSFALAENGVDVARVHDVKETRDAACVLNALIQEKSKRALAQSNQDS